jgi:hypothetical protein
MDIVNRKRDDDMAKTMTPSPMTVKQVERAVELFRAQLRKHRTELPSEAVQQVFGQSELVGEWFEVLRRRVEMVSNLVTRRVKVNRSLTPQQALDATGRKQYTDRKVVDNMPKGEGEEVELVLFKSDLSERNGHISDNDLEKECDQRGLIPADPYSLAALNEVDPAFADTHPNGTHWKDSDGKWCFAAFLRWRVVARGVDVYRYDYVWRDDWWFAGLRKSSGLGTST